jgi:hypothetical protein
MADEKIRDHIEALVAEEHALWEKEASGNASAADSERIKAVRVELDQYWDLLRQRRARREFGQDPSAAQVRDEQTVESYEG